MTEESEVPEDGPKTDRDPGVTTEAFQGAAPGSDAGGGILPPAPPPGTAILTLGQAYTVALRDLRLDHEAQIRRHETTWAGRHRALARALLAVWEAARGLPGSPAAAVRSIAEAALEAEGIDAAEGESWLA